MNVNHLKFGTGPVEEAIDYVLAEKDHNGVVRADVQILAGNAGELRRVCDGIKHKQKYKSAVFAFTLGDNPTRAELNEVISNFEKVAFAGLKKGTYSYFAVLHKESDGGQHLHILSACVHLETGKAYNPAAPGWQKDYGPMRDYLNAKNGWAKPDDPARARLVTGGARQKFEEWKVGIDIRQQIADLISAEVISGEIKSREDVRKKLESYGVVSDKQSKKSISMIPREHTKTVRLSGLVFQEDWSAEAIKAALVLDKKDMNSAREAPDFERAARELALMNERISTKAEFNKKRFLSVGRGSKKIEIQTENEVIHGPAVGGIIRERIDANRSRESVAPGGILRAEFDIERIPATAGFTGRTGLPVLSLTQARKLGSIHAFNDVRQLQRSSLDDAWREAAGALSRDESDHLEQGRSGRSQGLRRSIDDVQELTNDQERTSGAWRQDDARELAQRAISRANVSSGLVIAAADRQANENDQAISRAERAAERAHRSVVVSVDASASRHNELIAAHEATSGAVDQGRDRYNSVERAVRAIAGEAGRIIDRFAEKVAQVRDKILARIAPPVTAPAKPPMSVAAVAFAAADKAFVEAKAYERARNIVRDHRQGRGKAPTAEEIRISEQPALAKTAFQLAEIRERAANRLDAEGGMQDEWQRDTDRE